MYVLYWYNLMIIVQNSYQVNILDMINFAVSFKFIIANIVLE